MRDFVGMLGWVFLGDAVFALAASLVLFVAFFVIRALIFVGLCIAVVLGVIA